MACGMMLRAANLLLMIPAFLVAFTPAHPGKESVMIRQIVQLADSSRGPVKLALALLFALLVLAVYALVWFTGGIKYVYSHTMYLVIIAAALLLGVRGGVIRDVATVLRETDAEPSAVAEGIEDR